MTEDDLPDDLKEKVAIALRLPCGIAAGNSVIVLGEAGTGKSDFALALHEEYGLELTDKYGNVEQ
ncbi:MAG: hypothetical protein HC764_12805 [Pleurocapsa sp. CRU_1_2]|nr:hypothetical protein [Pleurocapsa sp. CRU_1_2]